MGYDTELLAWLTLCNISAVVIFKCQSRNTRPEKWIRLVIFISNVEQYQNHFHVNQKPCHSSLAKTTSATFYLNFSIQGILLISTFPESSIWLFYFDDQGSNILTFVYVCMRVIYICFWYSLYWIVWYRLVCVCWHPDTSPSCNDHVLKAIIIKH